MVYPREISHIATRMEEAACKSMLTLLGWNDAASSSMYENQAINYIDKFIFLGNYSVKTICNFMRRPGGVMTTGEP